MDWSMFFEVHKDLPREGPGSPEDVAWAAGLADLPSGAVICDAAAGPGADIEALLGAVQGAQVVAFDKSEAFVAQMQKRYGGMSAVTLCTADLAEIGTLPQAPFDMIWCAGALYFLGLEDGLSTMFSALRPGGVLAFSEPCYLTDSPSDAARVFWEEYPTRDRAGIAEAVAGGGFDSLGTRVLSDAAWEAYYQPMEARIAALRPQADAALTEMLDLCADEARQWREVAQETGYLLTVARRPA